MNFRNPHSNSDRPPLFMLLFMSMFGFIGLTVLISLWTARGFGAPPLMFKLFGSFIAIAFICMGFGLPLTVLLGGNTRNKSEQSHSSTGETPSKASGNYDCPNCGANIADAEVSPSGDIKCSYCNNWWNIHKH